MHLSQEKLDWLKSIGARELPKQITSIDGTPLSRPFTWRVDDIDMYYSEEFITEKPIDELKNGYKRYKKWFKEK